MMLDLLIHAFESIIVNQIINIIGKICLKNFSKLLISRLGSTNEATTLTFDLVLSIILLTMNFPIQQHALISILRLLREGLIADFGT